MLPGGEQQVSHRDVAGAPRSCDLPGSSLTAVGCATAPAQPHTAAASSSSTGCFRGGWPTPTRHATATQWTEGSLSCPHLDLIFISNLSVFCGVFRRFGFFLLT